MWEFYFYDPQWAHSLSIAQSNISYDPSGRPDFFFFFFSKKRNKTKQNQTKPNKQTLFMFFYLTKQVKWFSKKKQKNKTKPVKFNPKFRFNY